MRIRHTLLAVVAAGAAATSPASARELPAAADVGLGDETGRVTFAGFPAGHPGSRPDGVAPGASAAAVGRAFLEQHADRFGLRGGLRHTRTDDIPGGGKAVRFQQTIGGVDVLGGEFVVRLSRNERVRSAHGEAEPAAEIDTEPRLSAAQARERAIDIAERGGLRTGTPALRIFDSRIMGGPRTDRPALAWQVPVSSDDGSLKKLVFVEADRGLALATIDRLHAADANQAICDANSTSNDVPCTVPDYTDEVPPPDPAPQDARDAFTYSEATFDFFFDSFGRNSLDGQGLQLKSTVRWCEPPALPLCVYDNAFWDGELEQMVYGAGYPQADDVVGHELAHGVTEFTSNLFYYYQSGAINESMSDVFGELIDQATPSPDDAAGDEWLLGETIGEFRNMANPPALGQPDTMTSTLWDEDLGEKDSGGVHTNSGVGNKAAFLITEAIGNDKAAQLYYAVETAHLTSASDYKDLGNALNQACASGSPDYFSQADCDAVASAVAATGMLTDRPDARDLPACTGGEAPTVLFEDRFEGTDNWAFDPDPSWGYEQGYATSGTGMLYGPDVAFPAVYSATLASGLAVPSGAYLRFSHAYGFDDDFPPPNDDPPGTYDGGIVEVSVDGGAFADLGSQAYTGTIDSRYGNPLGGWSAFVRESNGYVSQSLPLPAGSNVRVRFVIGTDDSPGITDLGWVIDDVMVHTCAGDAPPPVQTPVPTVAPTATPTPPPVTPGRLTVRGARATKRSVKFTVDVNKAGRLAASGRVRKVRVRASRQVSAGRRTITVKLSRKARRQLRRRGRTVRFTLVLDPADGTADARVARRVRLKRAR